MRRLHKFYELTSGDRILLVRTLFLLGAVRLGLRLLPFQTLRRFLAKISQPTIKLQMSDSTYVDRVVWSVRVASPYLRATCLPQALATQVLLTRRGFSSELRIGVIRLKQGKLLAHAWVESSGRIVLGGSGNMPGYIRVPIPEVASDNVFSFRHLQKPSKPV